MRARPYMAHLGVFDTNMRRGMNGLALQRDPHTGDLNVFRGRRAELVKNV